MHHILLFLCPIIRYKAIFGELTQWPNQANSLLDQLQHRRMLLILCSNVLLLDSNCGRRDKGLCPIHVCETGPLLCEFRFLPYSYQSEVEFLLFLFLQRFEKNAMTRTLIETLLQCIMVVVFGMSRPKWVNVRLWPEKLHLNWLHVNTGTLLSNSVQLSLSGPCRNVRFGEKVF